MSERVNFSITDQLLAVTCQQRSAVAGTPAELALRARERQIANAAGHATFLASAGTRKEAAEQRRRVVDSRHFRLVQGVRLDFYELEAYLDGVVDPTVMAAVSDRFYGLASREERGERVCSAEWEQLASSFRPTLEYARKVEGDPFSLGYRMGDAAGLPTVALFP